MIIERVAVYSAVIGDVLYRYFIQGLIAQQFFERFLYCSFGVRTYYLRFSCGFSCFLFYGYNYTTFPSKIQVLGKESHLPKNRSIYIDCPKIEQWRRIDRCIKRHGGLKYSCKEKERTENHEIYQTCKSSIYFHLCRNSGHRTYTYSFPGDFNACGMLYARNSGYSIRHCKNHGIFLSRPLWRRSSLTLHLVS